MVIVVHTSPRIRAALELVLVVGLLGLLVSLLSAGDTVKAGLGPKLFLLARMAFMVLLCTWLLRRGGESWAGLGLRRPRRWWMLPLALLGGLVLVAVMAKLATSVVIPAVGASPPRLATRAIRGDLAEYLFLVTLGAWGSAAFCEELLLRGFVLDRIARVLGTPRTPSLLVAVVLQAALFGSFHAYQGLGGMIVTGSVGLALGLVYLAGGRNLWACILLHGLINTVSLTESYTAPPSGTPHPVEASRPTPPPG